MPVAVASLTIALGWIRREVLTAGMKGLSKPRLPGDEVDVPVLQMDVDERCASRGEESLAICLSRPDDSVLATSVMGTVDALRSVGKRLRRGLRNKAHNSAARRRGRRDPAARSRSVTCRRRHRGC